MATYNPPASTATATASAGSSGMLSDVAQATAPATPPEAPLTDEEISMHGADLCFCCSTIRRVDAQLNLRAEARAVDRQLELAGTRTHTPLDHVCAALQKLDTEVNITFEQACKDNQPFYIGGKHVVVALVASSPQAIRASTALLGIQKSPSSA